MNNSPAGVAIATDFLIAVRDHGIHLVEIRADKPQFDVGQTLPVRETWRCNGYSRIQLMTDCDSKNGCDWRVANSMPLYAAKRFVYAKAINKITPDEFRSMYNHAWKYGATAFTCPVSDLPKNLWFRKGILMPQPVKDVYAVEYDVMFT